MAILAITGQSEATSRGWALKLDIKKSEGARIAPTSADQTKTKNLYFLE
ncbi:hypothetical protein G159_06015 [Planococcus glaciei CHR43]|nr:hypothetical protein G159_06015 [Planococcus glaciei CHR43]